MRNFEAGQNVFVFMLLWVKAYEDQGVECVGLNMCGPQKPRVLGLSIGISIIKGHGLDEVGMALWGHVCHCRGQL